MTKITPQNHPSSAPSIEESAPSQPAPNAPPLEDESGLDKTPGKPGAEVSGGPTSPTSPAAALQRPINKTIERLKNTSESIPLPPSELVANPATELLSVGSGHMSGEDILRTIELIEGMESILTQSIERQLGSTPEAQTYWNWVFDPLTQKKIDGPDGTSRTVKVRSRRDHTNTVKARFLSNEEKGALISLVKEMPLITTDDSEQVPGGFHSRMLGILEQDEVPLHEARQLLPIQESGSLVPVSADSTTKPAPEFTPVTSTELRKKAGELGLISDD